jgi:hypothetical protein
MLPELAAEEMTKEMRGRLISERIPGVRGKVTRPMTDAEKTAHIEAERARAQKARRLIERLPTQIARIRELAEGNTAPDFKSASYWLR